MLDAIRKITLYVHDPEAALRFWTEQCHFVKRADHRMGPVRWLEVAPSDASPTSFVLYDKALMQQQNATVCVGHPSVILSTDNADRTYEPAANALRHHVHLSGSRGQQLSCPARAIV